MNVLKKAESVDPKDLLPGDVFLVREGPHRGRTVRVQEPGPTPSQYGNYDVPVKILNTVQLNLSYDVACKDVSRLGDQDTGPE